MCDKFISLVWKALAEFVRYDREHLLTMTDVSGRNVAVKEESINHRIALYIELELRNLTAEFECDKLRSISDKICNREVTIDLEYDLGSSGNHVERKRMVNAQSNEVIRIRPDILIHGRVVPANNFAFIEIKKRQKTPRDIVKCKGAKGFQYRYEYVLLIENVGKELNRMTITEFQSDEAERVHTHPCTCISATNSTE